MCEQLLDTITLQPYWMYFITTFIWFVISLIIDKWLTKKCPCYNKTDERVLDGIIQRSDFVGESGELVEIIDPISYQIQNALDINPVFLVIQMIEVFCILSYI